VYIFVMAFLFNYKGGYSRPTVALAVPVSCFTIIFCQHFLRKIQFFLVKQGIVFLKSVIVGAEHRCLEVTQKIQKYHGSEYQILGFISSEEKKTESFEQKQIPYLGNIGDLPNYLQQHKLDNLIVALSPKESEKISDILRVCEEHKVNYQIVPEFYDDISRNIQVSKVKGLPFLRLGETPMHGFGLMTKRFIDCMFAGLALIIASPVIFFVSLLIKLDSKGPVFFVQERVGNDGRKFKIFKFRSMIDDAEKDTGPKWATANDPRTTRVGRFIRMYNLDELPQFVNVLKGDMSLVGPRPERPYFVDKFKEQIPHYMRRHMVKAGITGWAQVNGLRGDTSVVKRTKYDLYYVQNWSLLFDLKILIKTLTSFKNAY
ncbi:undecaprenyl-phosphate glucose phosphotransferase, partial [bacterium]|nr:undecaprenyl-phosphate glucose phosphotransferase [bacterium]